MLEVYKYILNNLIEDKKNFVMHISFTKVNNKDLALIPGKIIYVNKNELVSFLIENGFDVKSIVIDRSEILSLSIKKEKLLEQKKKYQK